jgi:hypothetical protein
MTTLSEHEVRTGKLVRISDHDRAIESKNQYNFVVHTNDYFLNQIRKVIVKSISVPNTQYNVSSVNNTLTYDVGAGDATVSVPIGQYTSIADLLDTLAAAFLAGPGIVMTHTFDTLLYKATLTFGVAIILKRGINGAESEVGTSTIAHVIGLGDVDTASLLVHVMPDIVDLSGLKKVYISSKALTMTSSMVSSNREQANVIGEINMEVPFGYVQHELISEIDSMSESTSSIPNNLSTIDIQLLDERLKPVDLQGHSVYLTLKVFS